MSTTMDAEEARELAKKDPAAATEAMKEKLSILHVVVPPPPEEPEGGWAKQQADLMRRADIDQEKNRLLVRKIAQRELAEEEAAASGNEVVQRAMPLGTALFTLPEKVPALWGEDQRIGWVKGETLMLAAKQGLGKSTLAQNLFLRRLGVLTPDFMGMPVQPAGAGTALYLGMDRPPQIMRSMARMVDAEQTATLNENGVFWPGPLPPGLMESPEQFVRWVFEIAPACHTIVFDSVKDMVTGISKDEVGAQINGIFQMCLVNGIEVVAVHHQRKGDGDKDKVSSLDDVYGSVHMTNGCGSIFTIDGKPGDARIQLRQMKSPLEMIEEFDVLIDFQSGKMERSDTPVYTVPGVLSDAGADGITVKEIAALTENQTTTAAQKKVRGVLEKMRDKNGTARVEKTAGAANPDRWFIVSAAPAKPGQIDWNAALNSL